MTRTILLFSVLFLASAPGCLEKSEEHKVFLLTVANRTPHQLLEKYDNQGFSPSAPRGYAPMQTQHSSFGCLPETVEGWSDKENWTFTLTMKLSDGTVFAKGSRTVWCDEFTAWVHPDGYIIFEEGQTATLYDKKGDSHPAPAPWERWLGSEAKLGEIVTGESTARGDEQH